MYKRSIFVITALATISSSSIASNTLDEIIVTAKSNKSIENLAGAITVITAEDIAKLNATNIKDILVRTSGIVEGANESSTNGRKSISIRGLDSSYSLLLIDGKKVNSTDDYIKHSDYQYSWVPVEMIERIEIIKGPKSSIYGSSAIGGVINIITKKDTRKFYGEIDLQGGISSAEEGGDEKKISASIGGKITDSLSLILGANKNDRELTTGPGTSMYGISTDNASYIEGLETTNGNLKLNYNIDDTQKISASYIKGKETRELYDYPEYYKLDRDMYSASYEKKFEDISINLDYSRALSDSRYSGGTSNTYNYTHKLTDDVLKAETQISIIKDNYIVLGTELSKERYERYYPMTGVTKYDFEANSNAYYIQDEIQINDFIFTIGTRLDDNEKYGEELSPNLSVVYKLTENQRLKLSYAEGFKAPSLQEGSSEYSVYSHGQYYGNDDLQSETSRSYELGYEVYGQDTLFKTAIFSTQLENMITGQYIGDVYPYGPSMAISGYKYINVAKANIKGFETEIEYNLNENHVLNVNYTHIKTEDESTGNELYFKPKNTANVGLSSKFAYAISSYISANYIGTQYDSSDEKVSGYTTFNAQFSKKIYENLTARIGVDNITDKEFDEGEPYYLKRRFAYIGLNYKF
jgi:outer membrane receptor for ferrienterochelin and colicins